MVKRTKTPIKWTEDEWAVLNKSIFSNIASYGDIALPLSRSGRYPMAAMLAEAQQMLHVTRQRPMSVVQVPDRIRIIDGVNRLVEQAALALKAKNAAPTVVRTLSLNHKLPASISEPKLTMKVAEPASVSAAHAPVSAPTKKFLDSMQEPEGFSFESLGRMFDKYLSRKIDASVDTVVLETLKTALPQAVDIAIAAAIPKPVRAVAPEAIPGSNESRLIDDMLGVLEEVAKLRKQVEALISPKAEAADPAAATAPTQMISRESVNVEKDEPTSWPSFDLRPLYVVCGANSTQVDELKHQYAHKLRLKVFSDVNPAADLGDCKMAYVFEGHSTRMKVDSLRKKIGRDRVTTVRGGLSSIRRELERHVVESQTLVAQAARSLFKQA